jgi:MFS family permease
MSSSSINVQVGALDRELESSPFVLQLIVGAFLVAYAGILPMAGRLVDVGSRRAVFLCGVALFGVGCVLCAAAPSGWWLVAGRFVQGGGAALSAPAALALITAGLPAGRARNKAIGVYSAMGAIGFSLGLVLPGLVLPSLGWRGSFLIPLPLVVVVLAIGATLATPGGSGGRIRVLPALMVTVSLMLGVHAVGGIGTLPGWLAGGELAGAAVLAAALVRNGRRGGARNFPAAVTGSPRVVGACLALAGVFAGIVTSMYLAGLILQVHRHYTAFGVGIALVPQSISNAAVTAFGAQLVGRYGPGRTLTLGMTLIVLALGYLGTGGFDRPYPVGLFPAIVVIGAGVALCYPASSIMAVDAVDAVHHGTTASLLTTCQNVGGAAGLALTTAAGFAPAAGGDIGAAPGMVLSAFFVAVAGIAAMLVLAWGARHGGARIRYPGGKQ